MDEHSNTEQKSRKTIRAIQTERLRMWPPIVIAVVQLAVLLFLERYGRTNIHNAVALGVVPGIAALLTLAWWLLASRAPRRARLIGLSLVIAAVAAVVFSQRSVEMGGMLLALALRYFVYSAAIVLLVSFPARWKFRKWALAMVIVICAVFFCAMRVDSIGGDLFPVVSWRWKPSAAQRSAALAGVDPQGRAEAPEEAAPGDWPDFLGHGRHNRVSGVRFSTNWDAPPREIWRRNIGPGWSAFIGVGDYLFT